MSKERSWIAECIVEAKKAAPSTEAAELARMKVLLEELLCERLLTAQEIRRVATVLLDGPVPSEPANQFDGR